jgi:ribonuclease HII
LQKQYRPVVAAAAIVPTNISGVIDSKKITKEEEREQLYEAIVASPGVRFAVAVVSAQRIDEINILQATLEGMRMATDAVMKLDQEGAVDEINNLASADRTEISYVITGSTKTAGAPIDKEGQANDYHALIDGNKVPKEMPCSAESMIQGDGREFAIAAASILAKVTRDRLMHEYDKKYPEYELSRHKGYPTAAHVSIALCMSCITPLCIATN